MKIAFYLLVGFPEYHPSKLIQRLPFVTGIFNSLFVCMGDEYNMHLFLAEILSRKVCRSPARIHDVMQKIDTAFNWLLSYG